MPTGTAFRFADCLLSQNPLNKKPRVLKKKSDAYEHYSSGMKLTENSGNAKLNSSHVLRLQFGSSHFLLQNSKKNNDGRIF